jgi:hypothetical protein
VVALLLNTSLPLIVGEWGALLCGLVFIVALEARAYNKFRKNLKKSIKEIAIANTVSTIVGIPLANVIRYLLMASAVQVMPYSIFPHKEEYAWEALSWGKFPELYLWEHFLIVSFIFIVNFIVTVLVEYGVLLMLNKEAARYALRRESIRFNTYSYAVIAFLVIVYQVYMNVLRW